MSTVNLEVAEGGTVVTLSNIGTRKLTVGISGYSQAFPIAPGQTVKVKAFTSSELIGYLSQASDNLDVTWDGDTSTTAVEDKSGLTSAIGEGGSVRITADIKDADSIMRVTAPTVINLGGCEISSTSNSDTIFLVKDGASLTLRGNGTVKNTAGYCLYNGASSGTAGTLIVEGGDYEGATTAVHCMHGTVAIRGGTFRVTGDTQYLLNCQDDSEDASIKVYGGKFYGFDPANADTHDGKVTTKINYVADGYKSVNCGDYYEVVRN